MRQFVKNIIITTWLLIIVMLSYTYLDKNIPENVLHFLRWIHQYIPDITSVM